MDLWIEFYFALSEKWAVGVMGCRSNGLSELWAVGIMLRIRKNNKTLSWLYSETCLKWPGKNNKTLSWLYSETCLKWSGKNNKALSWLYSETCLKWSGKNNKTLSWTTIWFSLLYCVCNKTNLTLLTTNLMFIYK
jgi:hypothetical protein